MSHSLHEFRPGDLIRFKPRFKLDGVTADTYHVSDGTGREDKIHVNDVCFVLGFKWRGYPSTPGTCDAVVIVNGAIVTVDALMFELVP